MTPDRPKIWLAVTVAALGYFVDVFDIWLFANFRVPSLKALGLEGEAITREGAFLLNCQQAGFLLGGFVWGILGDKLGRSRVLFGSILLYSLGNLANAFVTDLTTYAIIRFITGFGLAGEIGAGVTLVAELMPREKRGYGVTVVATVGASGAIAASLAGSWLDWETGFLIGGGMGLSLLLLRVFVHESGLFEQLQRVDHRVERGSLRLLFATRERTIRFLACVSLAIPVWVVAGLYGVFAPELGVALGIAEPIVTPKALLWASVGITAGDLISGLLSQRLRSRKKPMAIFMAAAFLCLIALHSGMRHSPATFYGLLGLTGFFTGYWICALTTAAEQFGTNLRATVTTVTPNLVRASIIPITWGFIQLRGTLGTAEAALAVAAIGFALAAAGLLTISESFSRDLDFVEERHPA